MFGLTRGLTFFLAAGTLLAQILLVVWVATWLLAGSGFKKAVVLRDKVRSFVFSQYHNLGSFLFITATVGSLYYSEIAKWYPCNLCWLQRIFIYPQVLLFMLDVNSKQGRTWLYSVVLSAIGGVIGLYHYGIQMSAALRDTTADIVNCSNVGMTAECSDYYFQIFGYITIPMMSVTLLGVAVLLGLMYRAHQKSLIK